MTVTSTVSKNQYTANGSLTTFAYSFLIFSDSDLAVYVDDVLKTLTTDYTVTNAGVAGGGNVVFGTAPANTANVTIIRSVPYTQSVDYTAYDPFPAETHESALDRNTMLSQQLLEKHERGIKMKPSFTGSEVLVDAPSAGKALKWNSAGTALENSTDDIDGITSSASASAAAAAASATAAATSETNAATSATNASTSETNASTSATNAATSATNAATSETNAATSATSASSSATSATASASTATTQASAASTSATNAATSESNALTYKNAAETAKTAAEAAQAAAELAADNFDDVYLGAKASDPTLDNDGDALTAGDMYFSTTTDRMRVYSGSSWSDVALDSATVVAKTSTTGSGQLPSGTTAQRDGSPSAGYIRYNTTTGGFEGYGAAWGSITTDALPLSGGTMSGETIFADQLATRPVVKDYAETVYAGGNTSTAVTLAETNGNVQTFTMTGNCTFTMPSGAGLQAGTSMTLILTQDGTGSRTGAFTSVKWAGGTAPTLTTTATTGVDIITFYTFNGGASPVWYGFLSGADMS